MNKTISNFRTLAALLMAGAAFTACSNDDCIIEEQPVVNPDEQVYTLTLEVTNDGTNTRALNLDGTALKASWAEGEELTVSKGTTPLGTLSVKAGSVSDDGQSATFTGTLTGAIAVEDVLTLTYHPITSVEAFQAQDGTLKGTKGAEKFDMATATVTVATVNSGKITTTGDASFTTKVAMIKLTLTDGTNPINATSLNVKASLAGGAINEDVLTFTIPTSTYTDINGGNGILYFALPSAATVASQLAEKYSGAPYNLTSETALAELNTATIIFTATVGDDTYTVNKTGYKFAAAKYYAATLTMAPAAPALTYPIALSEVTSDYVGSVVTSDGNVYATVSNAITAGKTAAAMIAYVSGTGHGLALALADDYGYQTWTDITSHSPAVTGGTWVLASETQWTQMINAMGSDGLRDGFSSIGGTNLENHYYWSSTAGEIGHRRYDFDDQGWYNSNPASGKAYGRACLVF